MLGFDAILNGYAGQMPVLWYPLMREFREVMFWQTAMLTLVVPDELKRTDG